MRHHCLLPLPGCSPPPACDTSAASSGRAVSQHQFVLLLRGPPAIITSGWLPLQRNSGRTPSFTPWAQGTLQSTSGHDCTQGFIVPSGLLLPVLQTSLLINNGPETKICLVCFQLSSLRFASRMKLVTTEPAINEKYNAEVRRGLRAGVSLRGRCAGSLCGSHESGFPSCLGLN